MAEYSINFSECLIESAQVVMDRGADDFDRARTIWYLSFLATEISLKALLESVGIPIVKIKDRSHKLNHLLDDVCACKIEKEYGGKMRWVSAMDLRAQQVDPLQWGATVGALIEAQATRTSKYPNEIRYGDKITHYSPALALNMAREVVNWAKTHWHDIRV